MGGELSVETYRYIVVFDPNGGFVTGGGWINSPLGAYKPDPSIVGKANFGFVSKYKKGSSVPTGNTEFQFKAGDLNFNSYVYDWLVIAGSKAMFKGEGTINRAGEYGFLLSALDGDMKQNGGDDLFRIKIWEKANDLNVIYDNGRSEEEDSPPETVIGGGSIVIHKGKDVKKGTSAIEEAKDITGTSVKVYPNPFDNSIYVDWHSENTYEIIIDMVDMTGRIIGYMYTGIVTKNVDHHFEFNTNLIPGFYMLRIRTKDGNLLSREMILKD
jgi:hypothetical protein